MSEAEIIAGVIVREGGFVNNPADRGGPTKYGITAATLGQWRQLGRPATADEVEALEVSEASAIYLAWYVDAPGFTAENIPNEGLRLQLIDFGVNSGPARAIRWFQRAIGAPATGKIDQSTRTLIHYLDRERFGNRRALDAAGDVLVAARLYMIDRTTDASPNQKQFEEGLESRALEFFQGLGELAKGDR